MSNITGVSLGNYMSDLNQIKTTSTADKLQETLNTTDLENASDDEMMEACKSFEAYFVEQVFKEMKKSVHTDEDSEYIQYFGDMLTQNYAKDITEGEGLGIAKMLYESMKRNNSL